MSRDDSDPTQPDEEGAVTGGVESAADEVSAESAGIEEALAEAQDRYIRQAAEMENLRKRSAREVEKARNFAVERFARELLEVVDSLEMGISMGSEASAESLLEGTQATLRLLAGAMQSAGIEEIDPEGQPFDPELHEAMTMQPSNTAEPGSVLTVIQKGYRLNGRLLRPARVIVATEAGPAQ